MYEPVHSVHAELFAQPLWKSMSMKAEEDAETARWHQQQQPAERDFTAALQRGVRTILQVDLFTRNAVSGMYYCATTVSTHARLPDLLCKVYLCT